MVEMHGPLPEKNSLLLNKATEKRHWYGARHTQSLLLFGMLAVGYATRVNISVGIRAMTDANTTKNHDIRTYNWQNTSTILSSFFLGYVGLQILAGSLAQKYGSKWFLAGSMTINCLGSLLTPVVAQYFGSTGVIVCRVVQGLCQGFHFPCVHTLLGKWVPPNERSTLGTFTYSGVPFGTIAGMSLTGVLAASWIGWPSSFYIFGGIGMAWTVVWCFLGYDSPADHPSISKEEKYYIQVSLDTKEQKEAMVVPWRKIATSLPMWAILVAQSGSDFGFSILLTEIPTYLNKVIGFPMEQNGFLSAAPYLAMFLVALTVGPISDLLINKNCFSRRTSRKVFNSIGTLVPALALILLGYMPKENVSISVTLLIIAVGTNSAINVGYQVNLIDLSPNYAGILMGIGNTASSIGGTLGPLGVQVIVPDARQSEQSLWRIVFIIAAGFYVVSDIFYIMFASGTVQSWNHFKSEEKNSTDKTKYSYIENKPENDTTKV